METKKIPYKIYLEEDEMPKAWYNLRADMKNKPAPLLNPETGVQVQTLLGNRVFWAALLMGGLGFIAFQFMLKNITIRVDENTVKAGEDAPKFNVFSAFGNFMRNRPAVGATLAAMGMFLGMQSASVATAIMFATYFGMAQLSGIVQMVGFLPMFLFMPFIKKVVNKFGKKEASVAGTIVSLIGGLIMMVFPMVADKRLPSWSIWQAWSSSVWAWVCTPACPGH